MHFIGHEEVVNVAADEPGGGGLTDDYVDDVLAVPVAGVAQEGLLAVVVVVLAVVKEPGETAIRQAGNLRGNGPAGEGAGGFPHVNLGVIADTHGEEFQKLAAPVLVDGVPMVLVVVQPEDHGRVLGHLDQQIFIAAQAVVPEHVQLYQHLVTIVYLGVAGGEHVVPEQRHLFNQRLLGVDHAVYPSGLTQGGHATRQQRAGVIPGDHSKGVGFVLRTVVGGIYQLLHSGLVSLGNVSFELFLRSPEASAAHQVGHEGKIFLVCHAVPPFVIIGVHGVV